MNNLELWDKVERTNPADTKAVAMRGGFTSVCAHSQVKAATKAFGPVGVGWGYECEYEFLAIMVICKVTIWHTDRANTFGPLCGAAELKGKRDDTDAPKKAMTDGLTKGLSHIGFNADIFMGKFDDNKYVAQITEDIIQEAADKARNENILSVKKEADAIRAALASKQSSIITDLWLTLDKDQKRFLWIDVSQGGYFNATERQQIIDILPKKGDK